VFVILKSENAVSHMWNPSWCLVVTTMYLKPPRRAISTHSRALNFSSFMSAGQVVHGSVRFSPLAMIPGESGAYRGLMLPQESSLFARAVMPKWMNMPYRRSRQVLTTSGVA
jgi:hypothetical protein